MRLALCDDNAVFLERFEDYVRKYFSEYFDDLMIYKYTNGVMLLNHHKIKPFDIIFLDIDMPKITGFEIASELKKVNVNSYFVFVTSHSEFVIKCFDFQPFNFIQKDSKDLVLKKLKKIAFQLAQTMRQEEKIVLEDRETGRIAVGLKDVIYIESSGHYVKYHIDKTNTIFQVRASISVLEEQYKSADFIRVQKKFLVNLKHILNIDVSNDAVILKQGIELPLSRSMKISVNEQFTQYLRMMS